MTKKTTDISHYIWEKKYRYLGSPSIPADSSFEDTWRRVARAVAANEKKPAEREKEFYSLVEDFKFIPGGRIIANAGTAREAVTMFNCYVMNRIEDSILGIFDTVKEAALTQKQGGGVGMDFSTLRPANSHIKGCEATSSGPISFMQVFDSTCRTIMSAGQRRGAQMAVLRCDHPDIMEFVTSKRNNSKLQMFNLSVAVTDKFMDAVKSNSKWELVFGGNVYRTVHAVELWELIMKSAYDFAEPGIILIDHVNRMNNLRYCEEICATNPCGEQPLPPYGACLLGSVNLTKFISAPFSKHPRIKLDEIGRTAAVAVRFLDNVIDISTYPLPQQKAEALAKRRMGIGITGLADAFIMLGMRYGSPESIAAAEEIMRTITCSAYEASADLAAEKGPFPLFDKEKYCQGAFIATLPAEVQKAVAKKGLRNSHLTSIAPTGTISLLAGNISSGLEPVFAFKYKRKLRNSGHGDGTETVEVADYAYRTYLETVKPESPEPQDLPRYFITTDGVKPQEHIEIQAALQKYVDSSISKTINVPADFSYDDFKNVYFQAYERGLKGCTVFRPSEHIAGVLIREEDEKKAKGKAMQQLGEPKFTPRPLELDGTTYKIKTPLSTEALYLTINDITDANGKRRPYELFINSKNLQHFSWIVAMTRLISAVFRREPDPSFLVEELKSIYDPNGGYFAEGKYVPSLVADIGLVIEKHLVRIGFIKDKSEKPHGHDKKRHPGQDKFMICPQCNERSLYSEENCLKCIGCGYSKCG